MIELIRFDLQKKDEWDDFYDWFSSYLSEVCDEEEYQENIDDLHNDELNAQMIEQTLQEHNPYFVMRIVENEVCGDCRHAYYLQAPADKRLYSCPRVRLGYIGSAAFSHRCAR